MRWEHGRIPTARMHHMQPTRFVNNLRRREQGSPRRFPFCIAHQDYGWSNGQIGPDGKVWIIDLDGVAFDLTFRDLRKLITGTMDDRGDWDVGFMQAMIDGYTRANPIEPEAMQVMLIDMLLPNEFYKLVKDALFDPAMLNVEMAMGLERLLVTDEHKQHALAELGLERS